jgi:alkylation response protein AidB-like acyl-CoA dehydrogenase
MATKIEASRLGVYAVAEKKDRGQRCNLDAGLVKPFATETAQECSLEAMRIFGATILGDALTNLGPRKFQGYGKRREFGAPAFVLPHAMSLPVSIFWSR